MVKTILLFHGSGSQFQLIRNASIARFLCSSSATSTAAFCSHFGSNQTTAPRTSSSPPFTTVEAALDSFNSMLCKNPRPPIAKFGRLKEAQALLKEMCNQGQLPNVVTCCSLLSGLCRIGNIDEALALFREMEGSWLKPNVAIYNILIDGLWKAGRVKEARDVFARLSGDESLHPDIQTYATVIDGLCRHSLVDEAYDLFRKMERSICLLNSCSYNVIIHGFLRHKDPLEAVSLIQEMVSKGFSADATTLSLLIELLPKNQLDHPLLRKLLGDSDMVSEKITPTKSTTSED
ncbi:Pentatricopeptide repeat-containing protein At1g63150 [Linum perenne]